MSDRIGRQAELITAELMTSDTVKLSCFGNGAVVLLKARYELVDDSLMLEHLTTQDDQPIHTLVLHKVSR
jgi:hypothetical protein